MFKPNNTFSATSEIGQNEREYGGGEEEEEEEESDSDINVLYVWRKGRSFWDRHLRTLTYGHSIGSPPLQSHLYSVFWLFRSYFSSKYKNHWITSEGITNEESSLIEGQVKLISDKETSS